MQITFKSRHSTATYREGKGRASLALSQLVLLQSRRRWGIMYMLATVSGLFVPIAGVFPSIEDHGVNSFLTTLLLKSAPLLAATFLIITGMYVLNDLVDADLDKSSGKKRPISSGQVTKAQAHIFVIATNAAGIFLASITFNLPSIIIALAIVGIGLMYSLPKICLKDRFILKTASIAAASMLCLMLGSSYAFNNSGMIHNNDNNNNNHNYIGDALSGPVLICTYAALMSGSIIFITSLLNDLGDVEGDTAFGRRTIPVVIGKKNTVILTIIIAASMIVISWVSFYMLSTNIGLICPILVSLVASMATIKMAEILNHLSDHEFIRKQHKKSMSWHLMLQSALIVGALLFWV
ncbi:MAG: UbiA family prenyltransferase [Candidatus Nitrosopolaris sp.]